MARTRKSWMAQKARNHKRFRWMVLVFCYVYTRVLTKRKKHRPVMSDVWPSSKSSRYRISTPYTTAPFIFGTSVFQAFSDPIVPIHERTVSSGTGAWFSSTISNHSRFGKTHWPRYSTREQIICFNEGLRRLWERHLGYKQVFHQ